MILYKFDKLPGAKRAPICDDFESNNIVGFMGEDTFFSMEPEIYTDSGVAYVREITEGRFVQYDKKSYSKTTTAEASVIPDCKDGISIFKSINDSSPISKVPRGASLYLTFEFVTDSRENIWAKAYTLNDDASIGVIGYFVYKSSRHNFANVKILDNSYATVLTNGVIDYDKIDNIENTALSPFMPLSAGDIDLVVGDSVITTTMSTVDVNGVSQVTSVSNDTSKTERYDTINIFDAYSRAVSQNAPSIVQNKSGYPKILRTPTSYDKQYEYDYSLDYTDNEADLSEIYKNHNLDIQSISENISRNMSKYNRFKLAYPDDILSRGYMHIFFTRPDCNFFYNTATGPLNSQLANDPFVKYIHKRNPKILDQLVLLNGSNNQFMLLLSNKATSFPLTDDGIEVGTAGKSRNGYSVAYGRRRDSELGSSLNVNFKDTRNLDILYMHKLWIDYIINVYTGKWSPKRSYINNKILDYAVAAYVIVTAEDFETVLFWSKYYGIFPVSIPFSALNWSGEGTTVKSPDLSVTYRYSWKEDLNPLALAELNMNAFNGLVPSVAEYVPTYNPNIGRIDTTWVSAPFVELINYGSDVDLTDGSKVSIKLRFRP